MKNEMIKKTGRILSVVFAICVVLSAFAVADEAKVYKIGVLAKRGTERCLAKWTATTDYLTETIENADFEIVPLSFEQVYPNVEVGKVDFVIANPSFYVNIEAKYGASRIATLKNLRQGKVCTAYGGVMFTKADSDINKLTDLKGKRFMAATKTSLGGWQMAWRELKEQGIDPHKDFADLQFGGTHDAVVYAVRDGKVDAGTVRTDTLERMAVEGKIDIDDYKILFGHEEHIHLLKDHDVRDFPFVHSTRLYPEWPFAKAKDTPDEIAEQVTVALLSMSADSDAAKTANCAGWTIPHNYAPVHDCLRELRIAPYEDYGKITIAELVRQYWLWLLGAAGAILTIVAFAIRTRRLNIKLAKTIALRRQTEETLKESQQYTRELIEASLDPLVTISSEGKITDVNHATELVTGYPRHDIIGTDFSDYFTDPQKASQGYREAFKEGCVHDYQLEIIHRDGRVVPVVYNASVYRNTGGDVVGVFAAARDITERKAMESRLRQSEKLQSIGQLASGIAHEINTPTQYIGDNINFLQESFKDILRLLSEYEQVRGQAEHGKVDSELLCNIQDTIKEVDIGYLTEEVPRAIQESLEGVGNVAKLVQAMKEFAHPGANGKTAADINHLIESTIMVTRNRWKYIADMETYLDPELPPVHCLADEFNQVILNLIVNAADAIVEKVGEGSEDKGIISISSIHDGEWAEIRVADTGSGIPEEIHERILDPFFTTKEVGKGSGQGLALAYAIVVGKHGGTLTFETETGKGTTFIIRLPIEQDVPSGDMQDEEAYSVY